MAMPATIAVWMMIGRADDGEDVPRPMMRRVAQARDAGGVDVQLVADGRDRAVDEAVEGRASRMTPKITMTIQIDGPSTARAASRTTMAGQRHDAALVSQADTLSNQPP